jgi:Tfp pilus assembly protein PilN
MAILKINLLPPRVKQARMKRMLIAVGVVAGAVILSVPAGLWYLRAARLSGLRQEVVMVERESKAYASIIEKINSLESQEAVLVKKLDDLKKIVDRQPTWIKLMETLSDSQSRARDLWLISVTSRALIGQDQGKIELTITGMAFSIASVDEFVAAIRKSEFSPEAVQAEVTGSSIGDQRVVRFVATLKFKVPAS